MAEEQLPLFKYMKSEHADLFRQMGTIRIGTYYEYHDVDKLGDEVGDRSEGSAVCVVDNSEVEVILSDTKQSSRMSVFVRDMIHKTPEAKLFDTFYAGFWPANQYMFCTTEEYSSETMKQFGYDACIRIDKPGRFFEIISIILQFSAAFKGAYRCQYIDRKYKYADSASIVPEVIKNPKYEYQKEVRAIWAPRYPGEWTGYDPVDRPLPEIAPIIIPCPSLIECCTIM